MTKLCRLAYKYGTDKCPKISHPYTPYYHEMFKKRRKDIKKVIEVGVGTRRYMHYFPDHYITGASLYMWRDYFPNAQIYGIDVLPGAMCEGERIQTFLLDQTKIEDLETLIKKTGTDIDIFIDDGLHSMTTQLNLCKTMMTMLDKDVTYIIEDVASPQRFFHQLRHYDYVNPDLGARRPKEDIIVVKHK